jgi:hypothetical protein
MFRQLTRCLFLRIYAIKPRDEAELKSVLYHAKNAQYRSLLKAMKKAGRTIRKHLDENNK